AASVRTRRPRPPPGLAPRRPRCGSPRIIAGVDRRVALEAVPSRRDRRGPLPWTAPTQVRAIRRRAPPGEEGARPDRLRTRRRRHGRGGVPRVLVPVSSRYDAVHKVPLPHLLPHPDADALPPAGARNPILFDLHGIHGLCEVRRGSLDLDRVPHAERALREANRGDTE